MNDTEDRLLDELAEALQAALTDAIADARRECPGETFYAFVLYTLPRFDYAVLLFNTEERLARIAVNPDRQKELRWSPPDWEHSEDAERPFARVNRILGRLQELQGHDEAQCHKRRRVLMDVLKLLDSRGMFGDSARRKRAVVNIMWGDQDLCAHVESARELNPRESYLEYARHVLPSLRARAREVNGSVSMNKSEILARIRRTIARVESDVSASSGDAE